MSLKSSVKVSSLKRRRMENTTNSWSCLGTENEDPECKSPRPKKGRPAECQTPPRTALRVKDQNGRPSVVGHLAFRERSSNLSTYKKMGICADEMDIESRGPEVAARLPHSGVGGSKEDQHPNQLVHGENKIIDGNQGTLSPRTSRVDNYFPKTYKKGSPTNKRDDAEKPSGSILDEICVGIEGLKEAPDIKRMLLERSKSVCNIGVTVNDSTGAQSARQGTGYVVTENHIMTCFHLFRDFLEGKKLKKGTEVSVLFHYRDLQLNSKIFDFDCTVEDEIVAISENLDYVILKLKPDVQKPNQRVPPGLLEQCGPLPENGKVFIIGYPKGEAKQIDCTHVIELERREQAVKDHLALHQDSLFLLLSIFQIIMNRGIQNIMTGGVNANQRVTYKTKLYEGTSGSPVFDAHGQVFGLHSGGYGYGFPNTTDSVLEYGQLLCLIIQDLVRQLKESGNEELLNRIEFLASKNEHLKKLLEAEPMEVH